MIDILLVTYNHSYYIRKVIGHILKRTKTPFRLIIVDNGSRDGTKEWLMEQQYISPDIFKKVICFDIPVNLQTAKDAGLEFVESELFVDAGNGYLCPLLEPDWLSQLSDLMRRFQGFAAIALRPQVLQGVGTIFAANREVVENSWAGCSLRMMRTDLVKKAGGFGDFSLSRELKKLGYKVGYAKNLFTHHLAGKEKSVRYDPITLIPESLNNE